MGIRRYVKKIRKEAGRVGERLSTPEGLLTTGVTGGANIANSRVHNSVSDAVGGPSPWNDQPMPSSSDPQDVRWDPNTLMPDIEGPPTQDKALAYQQYAERLAAQKQERLFGEAHGQYRTAESYFQQYRPGAAMALASNLHRDQSNLFAQRAAMTEAPDMLAGYREHAASLAARDAKRAARTQMAMGIVQAGAALVGGVLTGGVGLGIAAGIGAAAGAGNLLLPGGDSAGPGQPGSGALMTPDGGTYGGDGGNLQLPGGGDSGMDGPQGGQEGGYGPQLGGYDQGAVQGGGDSAGGPGGFQGGSGGPEGAPGGAGPGAGPQQGQQGKAGQQGQSRVQSGPGGNAMVGLGGYGQDGDFTPTAMARATATVNPMVGRMVALEYAATLDEGNLERLELATSSLIQGLIRRISGGSR